MTTNNKRNWLTALAALSLAACTADVLEPGTEVGQLELPLVSASANGSLFMLGATFDLVGPETLQAVADPAAPNWTDDVLVLSPRVGNYQLTISAWTVYQLMVDPATGSVMGSSQIPTATLLSGAVQQVSIVNNQTTSVVYQFSVPGSGVINFARGTLNIDFAVQQGLPDGSACSVDLECQSLICVGGSCSTASCSDGVQNGAETSPDCGGGCTCAGVTSCTQAQAAQCADPAACTFNTVTQTVDCGTPQYAACDATQALQCPDPMNCVVNLVDQTVICGTPGGGSTCDPMSAGACPAGEVCQSDAAGNFNCVAGTPPGSQGSLCDPMDPATCAVGLTCQLIAPDYRCELPPPDPNLACVKINEVQTQGPGGASDEFVELYNGCAVDVSLAGARLVYRSAAGVTDVNAHNFSSGPTIAGGGYVVLANGNFTGGSWTVTLSGSMSAGAGGLALRHPDGTVLDSVAWQTAGTPVTNAFIEGTPALAHANGNTLARIPNGSDTNDNSVDFIERVPSPGSANF